MNSGGIGLSSVCVTESVLIECDFTRLPVDEHRDSSHCCRCMQRVQLVLVFGGLRKDPVKSVHQVFGCVPARFSDLIDLTINVAIHAPDFGFARAQRPFHLAVLLGVCIPADLHRNSQCFAVVVLAQHQAAFLGQLHQVLARSLHQSRVCRVRHRLR